MGEAVFLARHFQPALGGAFLTLFRHDTDGVGFVAQRDGLHLIGGGHFEIQRHGEIGHERLNIGIRDVTAIFAQVRGDAVGPGLFGQFRGPHRVRVGGATRVAHGRDVINVHPETKCVAHDLWPF